MGRRFTVKVPWIAGLLTMFVSLAADVSAQNIRVSKMIGVDFQADDAVVELDIPQDMDGRRFIIGWVTAGGQTDGTWRAARGGRHCYEMRHYDTWTGRVQKVGVTVEGITGRVKPPSLADEIDMFLEPERLLPSTVNSLVGHSMFSRSWNTVLLLLAGGSALFFAGVQRRGVSASLVLGFVLAWGVMDLRSVYDHFTTVFEVESRRLDLPPLTRAKAFADRADALIGPDTWGQEIPTGVVENYVRYRLAEHPYVPPNASAPPVFMIAQQPGSGKIVHQDAGYFLLRRGPP